MDIGSFFTILALLILVGLFVSRPFFESAVKTRKARAGSSPAGQTTSALLAGRDQVLTGLQDLDMDHAMGKIPDDEYMTQRTALLKHGADILRQLDALQTGRSLEAQPRAAGTTLSVEDASTDESAEDRIEAAIAARRAAGDGKAPSAAPVVISGNGGQGDDDLERLIASRRRERKEKAAGFCPQCGGPLQKSDHFCPKCGAKLSTSKE